MATRDYSSSQRQGPRVLAQSAVVNMGRGPAAQPADTSLIDALRGLASFGEQYTAAKFDDQVQQSYVEGERARSTGQALEAVEHDTFMKPFVRAGWAQQNYQIEQAGLISKASDFIQGEGKSKTPEEFQAWLQEQTGTLRGSINDSMSVQDRARALQAQVGTEQQLIQAHTSAHVKYNQEQYRQRITTGGNAHLTAYSAAVASGDAAAADTAMQNVTSFATSVLADEQLPLEMRQKTVTDYLKTAIGETGNYRAVQNLLMRGDLDSVPADQRMEIDTAINKAKEGGLTQERLNFSDTWAQVQRGMEQGTVTYAQFEQVKEQAMKVGMPASWFDSANDKWYSSGLNSDNAIVARALQAGDLAALGRTGKSIDQALDAATRLSFQQGATPLQAWADSLSLGMRYGKVPAVVSETLKASINGAIMNPEGQSEDQQKFLAGSLTTLGKLQQESPDKAAVMLQGFDADTQSTLVGVLGAVQQGMAPGDALRKVVADKSAFNAKSPSEKGASIASLSKGVSAAVDSSFGDPWYKRAFNTVMGKTGWDQSGWAKGQLNAAVSAEAQRLAAMPQYASVLAGNPDGQKALIKAAAANVASRGLSIGKDSYTDGAPHSLLIPPAGVGVGSLFGIPADVPLDKEALGNLVGSTMKDKVPKGWSALYTVSPMDGSVQMRAYDKDGASTSNPIRVDAKALGREYVKQYKERMAKERNGEHINVPDGTGGKVGITISNDGPGGMSAAEVRQFRKDLIQDEGLRMRVYRDTRGVLTGGIGQNLSHGSGFIKEGQELNRADVQRWFNNSSYNAMSSGKMLAENYGFDGNPRVQAALGKVVYQLGTGTWGKFKGAHDAIIKRDPVALEQSIRSSAWYKQTPKRAEAFIHAMKPELIRSGNTVASVARDQGLL